MPIKPKEGANLVEASDLLSMPECLPIVMLIVAREVLIYFKQK